VKKLTAFLAAMLSLVICLGGVSPAIAQQAEPPSRWVITFYNTPERIYEDPLNFDVYTPTPDLSAYLPENVKDFPGVYQEMLTQSRNKNGTNGSFTEGWFDLVSAYPIEGGTNTLFTINAPRGDRIYSVVAGLPNSNQCPLQINETAIAFFDNVKNAQARAEELDIRGYLVYVSPVDDLTIKAFSQMLYDQATGKKKTDKNCFLISGATKKVTIDFHDIFSSLPPALHQKARSQKFEFYPRSADFIYFANAQKNLLQR
jgi:hypothetical protein